MLLRLLKTPTGVCRILPVFIFGGSNTGVATLLESQSNIGLNYYSNSQEDGETLKQLQCILLL